MNARPAIAPSRVALAYRVALELRHGRIRLALAENELLWAEQAVVAGFMNPAAALEILNVTFDQLAGAKP